MNVKSSSSKRKATMGNRETEARQCEKVERHIFLLIQMTRSSRKPRTRAKIIELPTEATTPRKLKTLWYMEIFGELNGRKSKHACIVEAHESTRTCLERTLPKDPEDRIAGKGFNSLSHSNLVHKFIFMHQLMKKQMPMQRWTTNGKSSKNCDHGK